MTTEQVTARLTQLQQQREQLRQTLTAYEGAIQDCEYWLAALKETPSEDMPNPAPVSNLDT